MSDPRALFDLSGKVACVTGASSGLGRSAAVALAAAGARVVGVARRAEALESLCAEIGDGAALVAADIADRSGLAFLSQAFVPAMKQKGWGRIVNFASLQTTRAFPGGIAYGASKAGVGQLTRAMAEAWSKDGITANAIGPGFFPTELTAAVFDDPERAARNAAQTCIGRNGTMQDMDGPLLFLCSEASGYVTGQVLMVDGGFTAK